EKFVWIRAFALPFDNLAQPCKPLLVFGRHWTSVFVFPVRRDTFFGHLVHLFGANLHLELHTAFGHDGGVEGLVEVRSRHGNEVFDSAGNRTPDAVNGTENGVTVLY